MPRVVTYLSENNINDLKNLSKDLDIPLSKTIADAIDIGYKIKKYQKEQQTNPLESRKEELVSNHTEYLLQIMAVVNDIYRCVRNDKSKYDEKSFEEVFAKISSNIRKVINKVSENEEE
jgi:hypothetical protein